MSGQHDGALAHHELAPYRSDAQFLAAAVSFVRDGLLRGDRTVVVTTARRIEQVRAALGGAGEVCFVPSSDWYRTPARALSGLYSLVDTSPGRVRVLGEPDLSRYDAASVDEWSRYESALNVAFAASGMRLRCLYNCATTPSPVLAALRRSHPRVHGEAGPNDDYLTPERCAAAYGVSPLPEPAGAVHALRFGRERLAALRRFVAGFGRRNGLSEQRNAELVLAANEVATNAVRHGGGGGWLRIWAEPAEVLCEVVDRRGSLTDPFVGYLRPAATSEHGWGLWVTRQVSDLVEIRSRTPDAPGLLVRLHFRRSAVA